MIAYLKVEWNSARNTTLPSLVKERVRLHVNDEKYYILRRVVVSDPVLQFSISKDATFEWEKTMGSHRAVPFDNDFDVAWDIEFESASVEADNGTIEGYRQLSEGKRFFRHALPLEAITNADVKTLEPV